MLQRAHIGNLSDDDLCGLMALIRITFESFCGWSSGRRVPRTMGWAEEAISFREALLRNGS